MQGENYSADKEKKGEGKIDKIEANFGSTIVHLIMIGESPLLVMVKDTFFTVQFYAARTPGPFFECIFKLAHK